jgi:hypothetical protein
VRIAWGFIKFVRGLLGRTLSSDEWRSSLLAPSICLVCAEARCSLWTGVLI